jgi:hypothetical protein
MPEQSSPMPWRPCPAAFCAWLQAANASMTGSRSTAGAVRREIDNMGTP